jgi:hypothetical protein
MGRVVRPITTLPGCGGLAKAAAIVFTKRVCRRLSLMSLLRDFKRI